MYKPHSDSAYVRTSAYVRDRNFIQWLSGFVWGWTPSCEPRHVCFGCRKNRRSQALCQHPLSLPGTEDITRITTLLARSCTLPGMVYLLRASSFLNLTSGCVPSSSEGSTSSWPLVALSVAGQCPSGTLPPVTRTCSTLRPCSGVGRKQSV